MPRIVLFKDSCMGGESRSFESAVANLKDHGFNDVVSALVVMDGRWELFKDSNFQGTKYTVSFQGGVADTNAYPSSRYWGGPNDEISSLRPA
ncbi:MAG TPA: beta/gamma crystallin-related protein [Thermoanaerobaculia bacterium]|nr:beta/gamma crystallin-related protein [Thermoanaerobaculia bacterium]